MKIFGISMVIIVIPVTIRMRTLRDFCQRNTSRKPSIYASFRLRNDRSADRAGKCEGNVERDWGNLFVNKSEMLIFDDTRQPRLLAPIPPIYVLMCDSIHYLILIYALL